MKKAIVMALLIIVGYAQLYSQGIVLNAGDSYTYQFSTLQLRGPYSNTEPPAPPFGRVDGHFSSFLPGARVLYELFENSTNEAVIGSQTLVSPGGGLPPPPGPTMWVPGAWQDLQGAVRFTMLSGSVTITSFTVRVVRPEPSGFVDYWASVPEPSALSLICGYLGTAFLRRRTATARRF